MSMKKTTSCLSTVSSAEDHEDEEGMESPVSPDSTSCNDSINAETVESKSEHTHTKGSNFDSTIAASC